MGLFQGGIIRRSGFGRITVQLPGGRFTLPVLFIIHQVIRLHGDDDHAGIRIFHGNFISCGGKRTAFGTDQNAAFIIHAVFQHPLPGDDGAFGGNICSKLAVNGKIRAELAGVAGFIVQHQDVGRRAGECLPVIRYAVRLVIHFMNAVPEIQGARKIFHRQGSRLVAFFKVHKQIPERKIVAELVRPGIRPVTVPSPRIGASGPKADFIQGQPLAARSAENHGSNATVANGIPLRFPNRGWLPVLAKTALGILVFLRIDNYGRFIRPDQIGGGRLIQSPPPERNGTYRHGR